MKRSPTVRVENGSLYLDADVYAEFFGGRDAVAVSARDGQIVLFPLSHASAGGSLAKVRNARGDRVIHARELLRGIDVDDSDSHELAARWDQELAALTFPRPKPRSV
jgi:hypothetical protein